MSIAASAVSPEVRAVFLGVLLVAAALAAVWAREWQSWSRLARAGAAAAIAGASYGGLRGGLGAVLFGALTLCLVGTLTMLQIGPGPTWYDRLRLTPVAHRVSLGIASMMSLWAFVTWAFDWGDPVVPIVLVLIAAAAAAVHLLLVLKDAPNQERATLWLPQNSPIQSARSKSGSIRTWRSSARGAGPRASSRSCGRRSSSLGRTGGGYAVEPSSRGPGCAGPLVSSVSARLTLCSASKSYKEDDADGQQGAGKPESDECLAPVRAVARRLEDPDANTPSVERPNERGEAAKAERTESRRPREGAPKRVATGRF